MKHNILIVVTILILTSLACSVTINPPKAATGPTETTDIHEPLPDNQETVDLEIEMGAGTLNLTGGATGLVEGTIEYNVKDWKPTITKIDNNIEISQKQLEHFGGIPTKNIINNWNLQLGKAPLNLEIKAGAYDGRMDLGGLSLRSLKISDGASHNEISFADPNPEEMTYFEYDTGASTVRMNDLANANCAEMEFEGGAGNYEMDFSGKLLRDMDVAISSGVSNITLFVSPDTNVELVVEGGLNDITTEGKWSRSCHEEKCTYTHEGSGPLLKIQVSMGVGKLSVENK